MRNWKPAFLAAYSEGMTMRAAAAVAGIARQSVNYQIDKDAKFAEDFRIAAKNSADRLEEEARRRAYTGLRRKKFHQGVPIIDGETGKQYEEMEYSDTLLIFLMKGRNPEVFGDRIDHTSGGKPVAFTLNIGKNAD